jgi:hypothetical protein
MRSSTSTQEQYTRVRGALSGRLLSAPQIPEADWNEVILVIPSTRRPTYVSSILKSIEFAPCKKLILVSDYEDENQYSRNISLGSGIEIFSIADFYESLLEGLGAEALSIWQRDLNVPATSPNHTFWDLPQKRNAALLFAALNRRSKLILLDDDILGFDGTLLAEMLVASHDLACFGILIRQFPDISVVDHVNRVLYQTHSQFIAANCLCINMKRVSGYFPPLYNEDWLFIFAHPRTQIGYATNRLINQREYHPFDPDVAAWQEFGDVIAEGVFELWSTDDLRPSITNEFWESVLRTRRGRFEQTRRDLSSSSLEKSTEIAVCMESAARRCSELRASMLVDFVRNHNACNRYARLYFRAQFAVND